MFQIFHLFQILLKNPHKARGGEFLHGVAKGSHAGQDNPVRRPEPGGGGEDQL